MFKRSEGKIEGIRKTKLFIQKWEKPEARGTILITHGQGEHSGSYQRVVDAFSNESWNFFAWDLRGHGRSEGHRGYASHFSDYIEDYKIILDHFFRQTPKDHPVILLCHSMGGLVQLRTLIEKSDYPIRAQVCSSPLLGVALEVPMIKDLGAHLLFQVLPKFTLNNEIKNTNLTRDVEVLREFEKDIYRHHKISSGVYLGFKESFDLVEQKAHTLKYPTFFQLAGNDRVVSTPQSEKIFQLLGSTQKQIKIYTDNMHEIYNDIDRAIVFDDLKKFVNGFLAE